MKLSEWTHVGGRRVRVYRWWREREIERAHRCKSRRMRKAEPCPGCGANWGSPCLSAIAPLNEYRAIFDLPEANFSLHANGKLISRPFHTEEPEEGYWHGLDDEDGEPEHLIDAVCDMGECDTCNAKRDRWHDG